MPLSNNGLICSSHVNINSNIAIGLWGIMTNGDIQDVGPSGTSSIISAARSSSNFLCTFPAVEKIRYALIAQLAVRTCSRAIFIHSF